MTKDELIKKQNEIDEEIKMLWGENCSLDGITDIDEYLEIEAKNEIKTLWILKEMNRNFEKTGVFNQRKYLKEGAGWNLNTWGNVMKVTEGICEYASSGFTMRLLENELPNLITEDGNKDALLYYSSTRGNKVYPLDEIAMINVHKGIGGKKTKDEFIAAQYNRPEIRKIILEQVEYINPELIIVCNKIEKLLCDLAGVESIASFRDGDDGAKFYKNGKRLIISVGHPNRKSSEKYCNSILDIVYNEL